MVFEYAELKGVFRGLVGDFVASWWFLNVSLSITDASKETEIFHSEIIFIEF